MDHNNFRSLIFLENSLNNLNNIDIDNLNLHQSDILNTIRLFSKSNFDDTFLLNFLINENAEYTDIETPLNNYDLKNQERMKYGDFKISHNNKNKSNDNSKCLICLDNFEDIEIIINLKCNHTFHNKCLETWLSHYNNKCPTCRMEIGKSNPKLN